MKRGFTLIELIIVMVIIGILAMIAVPRIFVNIENARQAEALGTMRSIADVLKAYAASRSGTEITTSFPIQVDFQGDNVYEYEMNAPQSSNFVFSVTGASLASAVIRAMPQAGKGQVSYCMCADSLKNTKGTTAGCAITCP